MTFQDLKSPFHYLKKVTNGQINLLNSNFDSEVLIRMTKKCVIIVWLLNGSLYQNLTRQIFYDLV